uniref:OPT family small oligopeptide transporter n=1 Tax=Kwoniella dejecticola CBS 10117 TaxID=1296121 RepID=A0A1A5ZZP8_9TREE|nr:OPT family small oligopeptide transporter [Kwoniella dejecticola CBS 10117]OBR83277.1 OPT family small oligopeptide transporter [Kwoniella dejecticola CBS 10117]
MTSLSPSISPWPFLRGRSGQITDHAINGRADMSTDRHDINDVELSDITGDRFPDDAQPGENRSDVDADGREKYNFEAAKPPSPHSGHHELRDHTQLYAPSTSQSAEELDGEEEEDSPYPEVRVSVHPTDDPSLPVSTLRAWVLGTLMAVLLPGINQFFIYRYPNVLVPGIVAQLVVHPLGLMLAKLPRRSMWRWVNPGAWNAKEHTLVYIMANVSAGSAYATDIIATQRFFYNQQWGWGYNLLLVLSTQMLGFSFAGILYKVLVIPSSMIWPATLVNTALFNTLHAKSSLSGKSGLLQSRQTFFYINRGGIVLLMSCMYVEILKFDWVTWIKPNSQIINLLFGYQSGAGMSILTFDWGMMAAVNNPLATPWWVTANVLGGFIFFIWFLAPILYYCNVFYAKYLPFSSARVFDNTARTYDVSIVVDDRATLNLTAYEGYSPVYMTMTSALSYGLNFAAVTATIVHSCLFFRKQVWHNVRGRPVRPDIHARLNSIYPPVPSWWYLAIFLINMILAIVTITVWPTDLPVWALLLAILLAGVMVLPIGLIQAITNMQVGLNVLQWLFSNIEGICTLDSERWWCPSTRTFFSASVLYGLIGPKRLFGPGSLYRHLEWFYLLGGVMPLVTFFLSRKWPRSGWGYVCWPVVFSCVSLLPPYLPINFISFCIVGFVTQYYIRTRYFDWWSKYNYTLSAALTCGYALCIIFIFFALQLPKNGHGGVASAALHLLDGEKFGM